MSNLSELLDERFENYYKLPVLIIQIMNWLCTTRFYNKTFLERAEWYEEIKEKWKFVDFTVIEGTLEKPIIIKIGQIPRYKYEYEKSMVINFKSTDNCYLIRGYATGLYASKVISNKFPIPKYMIEKLQEFIKEYRINE